MGVQALLLLVVAIVCEVAGTSALRGSEGFTRLWPSVGVVIGYGLSFVALSLALKQGLGLGPAYAIWSGAGTALITIVGMVAFGDRIGPMAYAGIAMIIAGVVLVNLGGAAGH
jgi:small multidrug resistance pump